MKSENQAPADDSWLFGIDSTLSPPSSRGGLGLSMRIRKRELADYSRKMGVLLHAGVPLVRALKLMRQQSWSRDMQRSLRFQEQSVREGQPLSDIMQRTPEFDSVYRSIVLSGERSGKLAESFSRLADHLTEQVERAAELRSALTYPLVVLAVSSLMMTGMLVFVIPRFESALASLLQGVPLPTVTQWVIALSNRFRTHALFGALIFLATVLAIRWVSLKAVIRNRLSRAKLKLPLLGPTLLKALIARYCRTLESLLESAVPILEALDTAAQTLHHSGLDASLARVRQRVAEGDSFALSLEQETAFPPLVSGMLAIAEHTGDFPFMLHQIADNYEKEVRSELSAMMSWVEPLTVLLLALGIGLMVVAMFMPVVEVMQQLGI